MKKLFICILFTCACLFTQAQVNFVRNPGLEQYSKCPDKYDQITFANFWSSVIDTVGTPVYALEYLNTCDKTGKYYASAPSNGYFYQYPHTGNGMAGAVMFYDGSLPTPTPPIPSDYRDYLHGRFYDRLDVGKIYCVRFFVNIAEASAYSHNKIGAYIDDGSIDGVALPPGSVITTVVPQIFTNDIISDTSAWMKIEGSFTASGNERFITIGNFFKKADMTYVPMPAAWTDRCSYYLIDDISVIPIDLPADAGPDNWVEELKTIQIGRVGDTTAEGLDCKWYHKGALIDSGAIITVNAGVKGDIDTYAVAQTICGNVKTDTVVISTVGVGMKEQVMQNGFSVYPNPTDGQITIAVKGVLFNVTATIYDLLGRIQFRQLLTAASTTIMPDMPPGVYILELSDAKGNKQKERLQIR